MRHGMKHELKTLKRNQNSGAETLAGEHNRQVLEREAQGGLQLWKGETDQEGVGAVEDSAGEEAAAKASTVSLKIILVTSFLLYHL